MHMADALISPVVGGVMWGVTGGTLTWCVRGLSRSLSERRVPLMGITGAFVFTAQMVNFAIPGTGSSGHIGGGLLLSVLLGPQAAMVVMASVLAVQALFFADGGLLALGCNVFNMGFLPACVAYPLLYRPLARGARSGGRLGFASVAAAVAGLQLGALGVVLQTAASGISDLPFRAFVMLMQPIHLAIGVVEGVATAAVLTAVARTAPELAGQGEKPSAKQAGVRWTVMAAWGAVCVLLGGVISWFAATRPDGL